MPTLRIHTHLQVAQSSRTNQNLPKSMVAPPLTKKKKHGHTTMAIRNAGESANMKVITLNKLSAKRKVKCLEIPHYA
jgi:hypothetical protein